MSAAANTAASALPGLGQTALSPVVVLGVIFALAALVRRLQRVPRGGATALRVHASLPVGAKERVLLIEAGGTHLLIGVAAGRVQTLHVFAEAPVLAEAAASSAPPFAAAFAEAMKRALGQGTKP